MSTTDIRVPDIGDFKNVQIIEVHVRPGATIKPDDPLITLESDKAAMEVPAPSGGSVAELKVKVGDRVSQGDVILTLQTAAAKGEAAPKAAPAAAPGAAKGEGQTTKGVVSL